MSLSKKYAGVELYSWILMLILVIMTLSILLWGTMTGFFSIPWGG